MAGDDLQKGYGASGSRYKYGVVVHTGGMGLTASARSRNGLECAQAGTVHLGRSAGRDMKYERDTRGAERWRKDLMGCHASRVFYPAREPVGKHTAWDTARYEWLSRKPCGK